MLKILAFPSLARVPRELYFFANCTSRGSSLIARKTGPILTFEDLYKGMPSVLKSKVKWSSLVRNPPFCLNFLYSIPSTMSLIIEQLVNFCTAGFFVQILLLSRSLPNCCSIETVTKYKFLCLLAGLCKFPPKRNPVHFFPSPLIVLHWYKLSSLVKMEKLFPE